jgi:sec-independent protein translocase protein TatA
MDFLAPGHMIVIAVVALVILFGSKRLPEMSRSVGRSLRIFKTEIHALGTDEDAQSASAPAAPSATPAAVPVVSVVPAPDQVAAVD